MLLQSRTSELTGHRPSLQPAAMSQQPPALVKHPVVQPQQPTPSQTPSGAPQFTPRREFLRDNTRVASSFSLLALSGSSFVRLYSFSDTVISLLRRLFAQKDLVDTVREHAPKHFFEFALEGKPWSNAKSITSEKLIIDILAVIFHCGYSFLSTIDYGREQDDKLAIAFSKPKLLPNSPTNLPLANGSAISLNQPVSKIPFAISFSSATSLRVVGPPLHSTPAILQAVRGAWPRGVVSEKKVGDATYEFKLKGYKCASRCLDLGARTSHVLIYICRVPGGHVRHRLLAPYPGSPLCSRRTWLQSSHVAIPV